jgi:hypothetical protein
MTRRRTLTRLIPAVAGAAVIAVVVALTAATPARPAASGGLARQVRPVIDTSWLYSQLYHMASSYIYRVSGEDGPPQDPGSAYNLPPTYNGWHEMFAYWRQVMTSRAALGPLAQFARVTDHYFRVAGFPSADIPPMPFDSDVREVTIPGASCPGQRVLLGSHPDSTPDQGKAIVALINEGTPAAFSEALQLIYHSNLGNGSAYDSTTGVTLTMAEFRALLHWYAANHTWPARTIKVALFDAEETGLNGSFFYAGNLIPAGPQGRYVMVANMDQNGLEYPAYHFGTPYYLNNLVKGGVGPWRTNINASPLHENSIYNGRAWQLIKANLPAIRRFRASLQRAVAEAFAVLGRKYHDRVPLENPLQIARTKPNLKVRHTAVAYTPAQQREFSPVQDDRLGRTDQQPFLSLGIPGYGVLGAFDSNKQENPYPKKYKRKPSIFDYTGYDTVVDTLEHLNVWASGEPHGPGGPASPSQELLRGLELPATWTSYLVAQQPYGGAVGYPDHPVAYFETTPVQPKHTRTITFDARFSADAGHTGRLRYSWDFGDGSHARGPVVTHAYARPAFADVRLVVTDGRDRIGTYRQAVDVDGSRNHAPRTPACGTFSAATARAVAAAAGRARLAVPPARPVQVPVPLIRPHIHPVRP